MFKLVCTSEEHMSASFKIQYRFPWYGLPVSVVFLFLRENVKDVSKNLGDHLTSICRWGWD